MGPIAPSGGASLAVAAMPKQTQPTGSQDSAAPPPPFAGPSQTEHAQHKGCPHMDAGKGAEQVSQLGGASGDGAAIDQILRAIEELRKLVEKLKGKGGPVQQQPPQQQPVLQQAPQAAPAQTHSHHPHGGPPGLMKKGGDDAQQTGGGGSLLNLQAALGGGGGGGGGGGLVSGLLGGLI